MAVEVNAGGGIAATLELRPLACGTVKGVWKQCSSVIRELQCMAAEVYAISRAGLHVLSTTEV